MSSSISSSSSSSSSSTVSNQCRLPDTPKDLPIVASKYIEIFRQYESVLRRANESIQSPYSQNMQISCSSKEIISDIDEVISTISKSTPIYNPKGKIQHGPVERAKACTKIIELLIEAKHKKEALEVFTYANKNNVWSVWTGDSMTEESDQEIEIHQLFLRAQNAFNNNSEITVLNTKMEKKEEKKQSSKKNNKQNFIPKENLKNTGNVERRKYSFVFRFL